MQGLNPAWLPGKAVEAKPQSYPKNSAAAPMLDRTSAYNYGRCLPWFTYGANEIYRRAATVLAAFRDCDGFSARVWDLEMAMRNIRVADTVADRARATLALKNLLERKE